MIKIKSRFVSRDEGYVFLPNPSQWIMNSFYSFELIEDKKFKTFRRDFFLDILLPPPPSCKILARKFKRQVWDTKHLSPLSDTLYKAFISPESSFEAFCKVWRNTKGYLSKAWTTRAGIKNSSLKSENMRINRILVFFFLIIKGKIFTN